MTLHGTINHLAITVTDLGKAMSFFSPLLETLGYSIGQPMPYKGSMLTVNINESHGTAINIWQAKTAHDFSVYEPGLHHLAFNADSRQTVDEVAELVPAHGGTVLDGPGEFPFSHQGYYAVYFLGPDNIKLEVVYMAGLEHSIAAGKASKA